MRTRIRAVVIAALAAAGLSSAAREAPAPLRRFSAHDARVKPLLARMTLEEKVGQMMQPDREHLEDDADVEAYFLSHETATACRRTRAARPTRAGVSR